VDTLPTTPEQERELLWLFDTALIIKAVNGALEIISAVLILLVPPSLVLKIAAFATSGEVAQDPGDVVAAWLGSVAQSFAVHTHYFLALYLALHGAVKVLLVVGILSGKRLAYPLFMFSLAVFGGYEAYRGIFRGELLLEALAVFDFAVLILTSYEYRRRYSRSAGRP